MVDFRAISNPNQPFIKALTTMKIIDVVFISLSELPVVKDQDFKIVSFTTNHGLGKQSQYSL